MLSFNCLPLRLLLAVVLCVLWKLSSFFFSVVSDSEQRIAARHQRASSLLQFQFARAESVWAHPSDHVAVQKRIRLERGNHGRFGFLERFLLATPERLRRLYVLPDADNLTVWNDESCPAILLNGDVVVCGNLFVKGKLTVMQAANSSVYEELTATEDMADTGQSGSHTSTQISRFLIQRCSRGPPTAVTVVSQSDVHGLTNCIAPGNIIIPKSGLFVSGTLIVMGSLIASSVTVDAASTVALGVGSFLNLPTGTETAPSLLQPGTQSEYSHGIIHDVGNGPAVRRLIRRVQQQQAGTTLGDSGRRGSSKGLPSAVWPEFDTTEDILCHTKRKTVEALYVSRGIVFVRNRSTLFTFGRSNLPLIGIDRNSLWLSRCGGLTAGSDPDRRPADVAVLGGSSMWVTGGKQSQGSVKSANFVVSEGSFVALHGSLEAVELIKVALGSELSILGPRIMSNSLGVASGSRLFAWGDIEIQELAVISGALLRAAKNVEALAVEVYDSGRIDVRRNLTTDEYLIADEGAMVEIHDGGCSVGGSLLLANHSRLKMAHRERQDSLTIGQDLRMKSGAWISVPSLAIGCSLLIDQNSRLDSTRGVKIRAANDNLEHDEDVGCDPAIPSLLLQHSSATIGGEGIAIGSLRGAKSATNATKIDASGSDVSSTSSLSTSPEISLISGSELQVTGFVVTRDRENHLTVLKAGSSLKLMPGQNEADGGKLFPGGTVLIESASQLTGEGLLEVEFRSVELQDRSKVSLGAEKATASAIRLKGRSDFEIEPAPVTLKKAAEIHEGSRLFAPGGVVASGPEFDHLLSSTGSELIVGTASANLFTDEDVACTENRGVIRGGTIIAQDGAAVVLNTRTFFNGTSVISETGSSIEFACVLPLASLANTEFRRTPEAELNFNELQDVIPKVKIYRLKVPPSTAGSLAPFSHGLALQQNRSASSHAAKNLFWEHWSALQQQSTEAKEQENAAVPVSQQQGTNHPSADVSDGDITMTRGLVAKNAANGKWVPVPPAAAGVSASTVGPTPNQPQSSAGSFTPWFPPVNSGAGDPAGNRRPRKAVGRW